ncbi:uncharacterized protein LOC128230326 isoform X3 [Mya arenaria]|uniref:uncharacterized protein LOC128230326 isoform X3 n=1 Tax=Mya arenaria TaxID=6604 RepID=UPI0022DF4FD5|nr:uncharacterized protein LOC128230326 isoform X3 [Mya arenaria]
MNSLTLGLVVACAAFVEDVISTGIPYWYKIGSGSVLPDWVMASQAMMISSVLALGASILLGIMFLTILKDKAIVCIGAAFMSFAAGVLCIIGLAVAGVKFTKEASGDLHAGFGLAIIAAIHAFVAGAIFFLSRNRIGQM